jgi:hypothetical protein
MQSSVLLLTHSSCFMQFFSFIYLLTIIHSPINFIQYFSFMYFSSLIQQNIIHWFVIVIHPMFTMQTIHHLTILHLSLHEYLSKLNWFKKFNHYAHKLTKQQSSLSRQILGVSDHHFSIKSKKWNWHTTTVLKTVFFNFKSPPTKPPGF